MNRAVITLLNFVMLIAGFLIIFFIPASSTAIIAGMTLISASIISFAVLIYFPPIKEEGYVRLKIVEEPMVPARAKAVSKPMKKITKRTKKAKKKPRKKAKKLGKNRKK